MRLTRWIATIASAASSPASRCDVLVVNGPPVELLRVGAGAIQTVIKRGRAV